MAFSRVCRKLKRRNLIAVRRPYVVCMYVTREVRRCVFDLKQLDVKMYRCCCYCCSHEFTSSLAMNTAHTQHENHRGCHKDRRLTRRCCCTAARVGNPAIARCFVIPKKCGVVTSCPRKYAAIKRLPYVLLVTISQEYRKHGVHTHTRGSTARRRNKGNSLMWDGSLYRVLSRCTKVEKLLY